jgi:hypothetical protein
LKTLPAQLSSDSKVVESVTETVAEVDELVMQASDQLVLACEGQYLGSYFIKQGLVEAMVVPEESVASSHPSIT